MANVLKWYKPSPVQVTQQRNPFLAIQNELDRAMNDFSGLLGQQWDFGKFEGLRLSPRVDIVDTKDHFKVECELPGLSEEEVKVYIADGLLTIKGEKSISKQDIEKNYLMREITYGNYERSLALPENVDIEKAVASFRKGMLWIDIPKKLNVTDNVRELKIERK
jgi:HSP20 family protein